MSRSPVIVPILGMHRSGTSMLARALQLAGLALGEPLMAPSPDNPGGYWEHLFFVNYDEQLLSALGQSPSGLDTAQRLLAIPDLAGRVVITPQLLAPIQQTIATSFSGSPAWGWKDPRSVLLMPFWLRALRQLGYADIRPVVIVRDAEPCIRSLANRARQHGASPPATAALRGVWEAYNRILLNIAGPARWLVTTHALLTSPETARPELQRIVHYTSLSPRSLDDALAWMAPRTQATAAPHPMYSALERIAVAQRAAAIPPD